ncbi:MAG: ABC transporter substrate-binding protein [Firmicutes bacterium]|jgi:branched-chain amino acid transport system substrate-binding protein|nr:ABC transporter substrate-binding protein [Bacillota bacterium]
MFMRKSKALVVMLTAAMLLVGALGAAASGEIPSGPIKIGFAVPMSGTATSLAPDAGINAQIAVEYINKYEGGILGRPVQAFIYDTKGDPQTTVDVFGKLIENDGVEAVLGCLSSSTGLAIAPRVENRWKIPTLLLEATTMQMFTTAVPNPKYVYRIGPDDVMQSITHVKAVLENKPDLKTIALGAPDYEWGHDVVNSFIKILAQFRPDVEVVYTFFHPFGEASPNFTAYITELMQRKPDVYVGYSWGTDGVAWHNQAKAMGLYGRIPLVFDVFAGTAKGQLAEEGVLAETRAGNAMFPPHELGYPNAKHAPMILERVGALPTYGMGVHMLTGMLYLKAAYEKVYALTGQYPTPEQVATALDGLSIIGPCGITSMINHQSTAPGMAVGKMHQREDGLWVMEDLLIVPDYMRFVPPWMTVDEFIETLGKIQ